MKKLSQMLTNLTPPRLRAQIMKGMEKRVANFNNGDTAFDLYAVFMWWVPIIGGSILMLIGAFMDSMIVYGIVLGITANFWISLFISFVICFLIQIFLGISIVLTMLSILRGKYRQRGFRSLTAFTSILVFISLFSTLYLSFQSQAVVEVVKPAPLLQQLDTALYQRQSTDATANFDQQIHSLTTAAAQISADYDRRIREAAPENKSWLTHLKIKSAEKSANRIAKLQEEKNTTLSSINARFFAHQDTTNIRNAATLTTHKTEITYWGQVVMYSNFLINLLRAFLVVIYVKWVVTVKKEQDLTAQKTVPGKPILVSNTMSPREALKQVETPVIQGAEVDKVSEEKQSETVLIKDISGLKNKARVYHKRSIESVGTDARRRNQETYTEIKTRLADLGIETLETSHGLEFSG